VRNLPFAAFSVAACIALSACTTGSSNTAIPPTPSNPAPVIAANNVAANDAGDALGGGHHWDIESVQAQRIGPPGTAYTEIVVSTVFELTGVLNNGVPDNAAFAALPAAGTCAAGCGALGATALTGFILIDVDGSAATGTTDSNCAANGTYPGVDFFVDIGRLTPMLADGNPPVNTAAVGIFGTQVGEATISGAGNVVNVTIKIANIGGSSSGPFNVGVEWGNGFGSLTSDCAPNAGYFADSVGRHPLSLGTSAAPGISGFTTR
jgi:hypothetical protein